MLVRYATGFTDVANGIRDSAQSLDPDISVDVRRLEDNLEVWRAPSRIVAALSGCAGRIGAAARLDWRVRHGVLQREPIRARDRHPHGSRREWGRNS